MLDVDTSHRDQNNTFKILLATDIHLGYNEEDPIRGDDSFKSFEETLHIAQEQNVDFILLGGDLFHENKPTQHTLQKAVNLIKQYTFGNRDIYFQVIDNFGEADLHGTTSDAMEEAIPDINFSDPNLNIATPIFSIHGNHDDPTGMKSISSLDTLSSMGLVNYFGRCDKLDRIDIKPLLFKKGTTELAIYGVGHLPDKRFVRLHRDGKVTFYKVNDDSAFQMLVLHQNRANRGILNFIPDELIPEFMDLVMWGHEHDCYIEPALNDGIFYTQPGSTVATSLSEGEAIPKKVGILYVHEKSFQIEPIQLKTARIMIYRHIFLDTVENLVQQGVAEAELSQHAEKEVMTIVRDMLEEAQRVKQENHNNFGYDSDLLPLIRLVVQATDDRQIIQDRKVGLCFSGQVANQLDLVYQKRIPRPREKKGHQRGNNFDDDWLEEGDDTKDVMTFIKRELEQVRDLQIFTTSGMSEALNRCINCNDGNAIEDYIYYRRGKYQKKLAELTLADDNLEVLDEKISDLLEYPDNDDETTDVRKLLADPNRIVMLLNDDEAVAEEEDVADDSVSFVDKPTKPARGKGSRGARGSKTKATPRGKMKN